MSLREKINEQFNSSLKSKNKSAISTFRLILAAIKESDIANRSAGKKEDIKDSVLGLDFIKKLRSIEYKKRQPIDYDESLKKELGWYKRGASPRILGEIDKTKSRVGFIAQEVGAVLKDLGFDDNNDIVEIDETNTQQMIAYSKLVPPLVKAVQELSAKVEALENQ